MAYDWREFLELARAVRDGTISPTRSLSLETLQRTAVGRAYFAAFGHAMHYAESYQDFRRTGQADDHVELRRHFVRAGQTGVAGNLQRLRESRNRCDYDSAVLDLPGMLQDAIDWAEHVCQVLVT